MSGVECPICAGSDAELFLERPGVPAHQNVPYASCAAARAAPRGDLRLRVCDACGFVWNEAFDPGPVGYDAAYDNTQRHSPLFDGHMREMAGRVLGPGVGTERRTIVEIGCGKGDFLRMLVEADPAVVGIGFDTTYQGPDTDLDGRLRFERRLFDRSCVDVAPDLVVCRHVIEHIPGPMALLRELRSALGDRAVRLFFETPDVGWILEHRVVWDFFHEHCSLFTPGSLTAAFHGTGFAVTGAERVFGGQYLWLEASTMLAAGGRRSGVRSLAARSAAAGSPVPRVPMAAAARDFGVAERELVGRWERRLAALHRWGPVAIWGAGAKGVTLANLCDPSATHVSCVVDINPGKQGRFVAGSGHPIVAPEALVERGVRSVVLMNPNYETEVRAALRQMGGACELILS
jgi:SAM-dependent methyltransferase